MSRDENARRIRIGAFDVVLAPGMPGEIFAGMPVTRDSVRSVLMRNLGDDFAVRQLRAALSEHDFGAQRLDDHGIIERVAMRIEFGRWQILRTPDPRPPLDAPTVTDLSDLIKTRPEDPTTLEPDRPRPQLTTFEVRLVDELGEALSDVPVRVVVGGAFQLTTDDAGVVRVEDAEVSFGSAQITSYALLREELHKRWSEARGREWVVPEDPQASTIVRYREPIETIALRAKTSHTLVIQPAISRARVVGAAFDTNKVFLRPSLRPTIRCH
jgi:hypothetical protein